MCVCVCVRTEIEEIIVCRLILSIGIHCTETTKKHAFLPPKRNEIGIYIYIHYSVLYTILNNNNNNNWTKSHSQYFCDFFLHA